MGERFYVERVTPLPFSHVLANRSFGCLCSDTGLGNTWWKNARECKLTPWLNDIARANDGERLLLQVDGTIYDLADGARASFSPEDARWEGAAGEVEFSLRMAVAPAGGVKTLDLTLENRGEKEAELAVAYYLEPVLGVSALTSKYVQFGQRDGCLTLRNPYNAEVRCHTAVHVPGEHPSHTVDRAAFWAGDWSPTALLPNNDPIAGTVVKKRLPPRRKERVRFILSAAATEDAAVRLALAPPEGGGRGWAREIRVLTPSEPLNRLVNGLLPHQIRAGRLWGRCAFYQCSGAYGFRDQLQDAAALLPLDPALAREQIARCCAVQFPEGDVLHWWHRLPGGTRGVRTRFSDDLVWLPLTVCDYLAATGDYGLLNLEIRYCEGEKLGEGERERYQQVRPAERIGSVYDHCIRAIDHAYNLGDKGLPKIGGGDWNDGFSAVGAGGRGQSVWMAMFLAMVCDRFAPLCERCEDRFRAGVYRGYAAHLRAAVDRSCWDGGWYLRAFYDDGAPLGGAECDECKIDLLPQSFAVLSGMPDAGRARRALDEAVGRLVDREGRVVKLFAPPFDSTARDPGYIKAYPAGIRENGGQYTHGAIWLATALLRAGRAREGWALLDLLNPVSRCVDGALARAYKLEPYYLAADVYTHPGAYGHGGWSIYTGAAGWYYRAAVNELLGLRFLPGRLELWPRIPEEWGGFSAVVTAGGGTISIQVRRSGGPGLLVDGAPAASIPLDGRDHEAVLAL